MSGTLVWQYGKRGKNYCPTTRYIKAYKILKLYSTERWKNWIDIANSVVRNL